MSWYFDAQIFGFLLFDLAFIAILWRHGRKFFSEFINDSLIFVAIIAWAVIAYGSFFEPRRIAINEQSITISEQPTDTLIAAVISDSHVGPYKKADYIRSVIEHIVEIRPNIVLFAGDFVFDDTEQVHELAPLKDISLVYPIYAVLGNHDYNLVSAQDDEDSVRSQDIAETLESYGIHILNNEGLLVPGHGVWLAGIEDVWTRRARIGDALFSRPVPTPPTLLLSHNPDAVLLMRPSQQIDLVIAGHTHGGQIRLPLIGPVPEIPNELGRQFDEGLFTIEGTQLFITSGIGESGPRARLFNPPEIAVVQIHY